MTDELFFVFSSLLEVSILVQRLHSSEEEVAPPGQAPDKPQIQTDSAVKIQHSNNRMPKLLTTMLTSKQLQALKTFDGQKGQKGSDWKKELKYNKLQGEGDQKHKNRS